MSANIEGKTLSEDRTAAYLGVPVARSPDCVCTDVTLPRLEVTITPISFKMAVVTAVVSRTHPRTV